ncbi:Trypsin domain protein [gamma proteobacterium NOR5-3]|nr:Trypsin domain protein [gamma proteobacterium NOR5-3]
MLIKVMALAALECVFLSSTRDSNDKSMFFSPSEPSQQFCHRLWIALLLAVIATSAGNAQTPPGGSAAIVLSVGKLHVPGQRYENGYARHYDESCSATLISDEPGAQLSALIISAWHCMEFYRDTSKPLTFETPSGEIRNANLITSGGSMYSDWALLRLDAPLPAPAILPPEQSEITEALLMAGYPRSASSRARLRPTVSHCQITGVDGADTRSDCVLQKGASGGAVFSADNNLQYVGVISRGDGESQSIYVPLARFRAKISAYLESSALP